MILEHTHLNYNHLKVCFVKTGFFFLGGGAIKNVYLLVVNMDHHLEMTVIHMSACISGILPDVVFTS